MKLLLDQNLTFRLLQPLVSHFPGSTHTKLVGLAHVDDLRVWDFAREHGFVVVTKDADFLELVVLRGHPPKVVLLRCGNISNGALQNLLLRHLDDVKAFDKDPLNGCLEIG